MAQSAPRSDITLPQAVKRWLREKRGSLKWRMLGPFGDSWQLHCRHKTPDDPNIMVLILRDDSKWVYSPDNQPLLDAAHPDFFDKLWKLLKHMQKSNERWIVAVREFWISENKQLSALSDTGKFWKDPTVPQ